MEHPEGATAGAKGEPGVKVEEGGDGAAKRATPPTMAELLCLMLSIQQEMRRTNDELTKEVAAARLDQDWANEKLTERLEAMEKAAQDTYGEVSRLGDRWGGLPPPTQQAAQQGGMGTRSPSPSLPASPAPPPSPPPAAATASAPGFAASTPPAGRHPPAGAAGMPPRRPRPQVFDGGVSLEAYMAQFELLAQAQAWDEQEKAVQLAASLKGPAVEVLGQLSATQRASYDALVAALERRYGHQHQAEGYRARFRKRVRARGETLQELAQDLENLVGKAYPGAPEETTSLLLRDQFVEALRDHEQLQIYVLQAHVSDMQQALARALEFESFLRSTAGRSRRDSGGEMRVRGAQVKRRGKERRGGGFGGRCWSCGQQGHTRRECAAAPRSPRSRSAERGRQRAPSTCCWECGETGHLARSCPARNPGNGPGLGHRAGQPTGRPHSR